MNRNWIGSIYRRFFSKDCSIHPDPLANMAAIGNSCLCRIILCTCYGVLLLVHLSLFLGQRQIDFWKEVTPKERFNWYGIFYDRTRQRWPFNTGYHMGRFEIFRILWSQKTPIWNYCKIKWCNFSSLLCLFLVKKTLIEDSFLQKSPS